MHVNFINVFHDVSSVLYTETKFTKAGILIKVINVFCSENVNLFTVTSVHGIRKSQKKPRNSETIWKVTQNIQGCKRLKQVKGQTNGVDKLRKRKEKAFNRRN